MRIVSDMQAQVESTRAVLEERLRLTSELLELRQPAKDFERATRKLEALR